MRIGFHEYTFILVRDLEVYLAKVLMTIGTVLTDHKLNGGCTDAVTHADIIICIA